MVVKKIDNENREKSKINPLLKGIGAVVIGASILWGVNVITSKLLDYERDKYKEQIFNRIEKERTFPASELEGYVMEDKSSQYRKKYDFDKDGVEDAEVLYYDNQGIAYVKLYQNGKVIEYNINGSNRKLGTLREWVEGYDCKPTTPK